MPLPPTVLWRAVQFCAFMVGTVTISPWLQGAQQMAVAVPLLRVRPKTVLQNPAASSLMHKKNTLLDAHVQAANREHLWFDKSRMIKLSGTASVRSGESRILASKDQQNSLKPGDYIILANPDDISTSIDKETASQSLEDALQVVAVHARTIVCDHPWPDDTSDNLMIFKVVVSADAFIRNIRHQRPNLNTTTAVNVSTTITTTPVSTKLRCEGKILGDLALVHDSCVVTTSSDLRQELNIGQHVLVEGQEFVVTEPRDEITFTLSSRWQGSTKSGVKVCKLQGEPQDCTPLSGCVDLLNQSRVVRTSADLRNQILPGDVIRILWAKHADNFYESTVTHPTDYQTLTISGRWTGPNLNCIKACKKLVGWGIDGLLPLCGTVATTKDSSVVYTSCDLRNVLSEHDWVRIGTQSLLVSGKFTDKLMTMSTRLENSASEVKAYKLAQEFPLPGTLSVIAGSPTVTTTSDLRSVIGPGDLLRIFQSPTRADRFEVALPQDTYTMTLSKPHPGPTASGLKGYKIVGTALPLSGYVNVVSNSSFIRTSTDLTGEISVGDTISIADDQFAVEAIAPSSITINKPWPGVTTERLSIFKSGKSAEQQTLEALAREKLKCTTIYCLSQIELREAALPFDYPRTLTLSSSNLLSQN